MHKHDHARSGDRKKPTAARDLGRDGITRMVNHDRALRARGLASDDAAPRQVVLGEDEVLPDLLARIRGQQRKHS